LFRAEGQTQTDGWAGRDNGANSPNELEHWYVRHNYVCLIT